MAKTEKDEFYDDILITAVEGGIGYWCVGRNYQWSDEDQTTIEVHEEEQSGDIDLGWIALDRAKIRHAVAVIMDRSNDLDLHESYRQRISEAYRENDAGEIDADDADVIVQVAVFGNVIYG
jgi:hypothetical protein